MLTFAQRQVLDFYHNTQLKGELCPSYDEVTEALGYANKSRVYYLVQALEERGFVRRLPNRARSLMVLRDRHGVRTDVEENEGDIIGALVEENQRLRKRLSRWEHI